MSTEVVVVVAILDIILVPAYGFTDGLFVSSIGGGIIGQFQPQMKWCLEKIAHSIPRLCD